MSRAPRRPARPRLAELDRRAIEAALPPAVRAGLEVLGVLLVGDPRGWWGLTSARVVAKLAAVEHLGAQLEGEWPGDGAVQAAFRLSIDPETHEREIRRVLAEWRRMGADKLSVTSGDRSGRVAA